MKPMRDYSLILQGVKNPRRRVSSFHPFKGTSEATRSLMRPYCFLLCLRRKKR